MTPVFADDGPRPALRPSRLGRPVVRARIARREIRVADVPTEEVRPIALYHERQLDALVQKLWGSVRERDNHVFSWVTL